MRIEIGTRVFHLHTKAPLPDRLADWRNVNFLSALSRSLRRTLELWAFLLAVGRFAAPRNEGLSPVHWAGTSERRSVRVQYLGLIDHAHTASAELFDDAVVRDGLTDHWSRILRL
jgi:hypothetical protein